jgi:NADPH-dependent 2,4-dienoyl-CoA reductase/sulfur reductase-like enzyme
LSKKYLSGQLQPSELSFAVGEELDRVSWILDTPVVGVDIASNMVRVSDGSQIQFDDLVIATGVRPRRNPEWGDETQNSFVLRTKDDADLLKAALQSRGHLIIQGGGFMGTEVAAMALTMGCQVTLISRSKHILSRQLGELVGQEAQRRHQERGLTVITETDIVRPEFGTSTQAGRFQGVVLTNGQEVEGDIFLQATGSVPNTEWLEGSGIDINDGVLTGKNLRAVDWDGNSVPNVFAGGDVARFPNPIFDATPRRVEQWNIPSECAKYVARQICSGASDDVALADGSSFSAIPSFWSDQFEFSFFGLGIPSLATRAVLMHGELDSEFVVGYFRDRQLVGVCGNGLRASVQSYRSQIGKPLGMASNA